MRERPKEGEKIRQLILPMCLSYFIESICPISADGEQDRLSPSAFSLKKWSGCFSAIRQGCAQSRMRLRGSGV